MQRTLNLATLAAAACAALALQACDRSGDRDTDRTVGQSVDRTVADARTGARDAAEAVKEAGAKAADAAGDAAITTKINAALVADDRLKATRIDVDTKNGRVVLSGSAPDPDAKERAAQLAQAVEGVSGVDNRLTVKP